MAEQVEGSEGSGGETKPLHGKTFAFYGEFAVWPRYHGGRPAEVAQRLGAVVTSHVDAQLDYLVLGDRRAKGRAEARKKAERVIKAANKVDPVPDRCLQILDESAFREMVRADVAGKRFHFCGGFDCCPAEFDAGLLQRMVEAVGAVPHPDIDEQLDYLVVGNRRGKGKTAALRSAENLQTAGVSLAIISEEGFLELVRSESSQPNAAGERSEMPFASFVGNLYGVVNERKIQRAMKMLQTERFRLYCMVESDHLVGVVRSQTDERTVYAPFLDIKGRYGCSTTDLAECMGLQGSPCKHLLVLLIGLARAGEIKPLHAWDWIRVTSGKGPRRDDEYTTAALLQYKGVMLGELDWRPTETIPEDYYTF